MCLLLNFPRSGKGQYFIFCIVFIFCQSGMPIGAFDVDEVWTLAEETMLLDAVEQYGFGNW